MLPSAPQLALIACMMAIIFVLWKRSRATFDRQREWDETSPASVVAKTSPDELTRWQVELHETARDVKGEIDTKLALLQLLIRHANDATARLDAALARAKRLGLVGPRDPLTIVDQWHERSEADDLPQRPDPSHQHPCAERIFALADAGGDVGSIAVETGLPQGEIEMILSLRVGAR